MRYEVGTVINVSALNHPVRAQAITEPVYDGVNLYSLAKDTDIPVQTNPNYHCFFLLSGKLNVFTRDRLEVKAAREMTAGQAVISPLNEPVGATVLEDSVAVEVILGKKLDTDVVKPMEPFMVRDLAAYQPGRAYEKSIFKSGFMVFDVCVLDMRTEMDEVLAPGEMILSTLDGEGIVEYLGKEYTLHGGENFRIAAKTAYRIKTQDTQFKVSLLIKL